MKINIQLKGNRTRELGGVGLMVLLLVFIAGVLKANTQKGTLPGPTLGPKILGNKITLPTVTPAMVLGEVSKIDMPTEKLLNQGVSDKSTDIYQDVIETDIDNIDPELADIAKILGGI